jgi:serine/threonine-protein kinase
MEGLTSSTTVRGAAPSPDDAASLTPILRIGRYDVLGRLAIGGMSELFLAHERVAGEALRRVVIKVLATPEKSVLEDSAWVALFEREGRTTARLDHPNICHVYEFGHVGAQCFIAMEWVQGVSLRELLIHLRDSHAGLPMPLAVNIGAQVAAALEPMPIG